MLYLLLTQSTFQGLAKQGDPHPSSFYRIHCCKMSLIAKWQFHSLNLRATPTAESFCSWPLFWQVYSVPDYCSQEKLLPVICRCFSRQMKEVSIALIHSVWIYTLGLFLKFASLLGSQVKKNRRIFCKCSWDRLLASRCLPFFDWELKDLSDSQDWPCQLFCQNE